MAVSYHKCDDSVGEFMEAECDPRNPAGGERFLGRGYPEDEFLDDRYPQEYSFTGEY